jgi:hypothetical protein
MMHPRFYVQSLPSTASDERQHVLDDSCWCHPTLSQVAIGTRFDYLLTHYPEVRDTR